MIASTPLVSLQAPKEISIEQIEAELQEIWLRNSTEEGLVATRATTFSFLVYEPDRTQQLLAALGFYTGPLDGITGSRTTAAIKAAQKAYGLEETGKATPQLSLKLGEEFDKLKENASPEVQNLLDSKYSPDLDGSGIADAIASSNPCRIITLSPTVGAEEGVQVQVSAYCPINKRGHNSLICCEYINLKGTANELERIGGIISELMIAELPKFLWWKAAPDTDYGLFKRLISISDAIIFDSSDFQDPETELAQLANLIKKGVPIADLNWSRLSPWQELVAEAFDPPERRSAIWEVDRVTIDYEKGNPAQALMYVGWLASRLKWTPFSYEHEGGDYDLRKLKFTTEAQHSIEVELAGIPIADVGEVPGDLISLRLSSTNLEADCCTVLCSETTGCMRMEAGGGAQACRIQQVTPVFDQKKENLIGQQLQRWGQDLLYQESMDFTHQILQISQ